MELTTFDFNDHDIRIADLGGEPWFIAKDVFDTLGYPTGSRTYQLKQLESDEVSVLKIKTPYGLQSVKTLSESGLYKLIMRSDKPKARDFQNWVTRVVLPAIRKDGGYIAGEEKLATGRMSEEEFVLKAMTMLKAKADRLQKHVSDHLEYMTVDEFFALKHIYPDAGDATALGRRASRICKEVGETRRVQRRYVPKIERVVELGEYPVAVLEEAFETMVEDGRIPVGLPQMELGLVH